MADGFENLAGEDEMLRETLRRLGLPDGPGTRATVLAGVEFAVRASVEQVYGLGYAPEFRDGFLRALENGEDLTSFVPELYVWARVMEKK